MDRRFHSGFSLLLLCAFNCVTISYEAAPTVQMTPQSPAGVESSTIAIFCKVQGSPTPTVTWYKNGTLLKDTRIRQFALLNGSMIRIIHMRQHRHQATYKCEANNGVDPPISATTQLTVYRARNTPPGFPRFSRRARPVFETIGQPVILGCTATGTPQPTISWTKDKFPLDISGPRYTAVAAGLRIEQLRKSDEGGYECIATNSKGILYSRRINVYARDIRRPPTFSVTPTNKTVDPETDVTLRCAASGSPSPTLLWRREGERVWGNPDLSLTLRNIKASGRYTCIAFNQWGRIHSSAYVTVRALPFSPTELRATKISPHAITVEWQRSGGPAATSYKLDYRKKGNAVWFEVNIRGYMSSTVDKLQPYENYEFRVFALNDLGTSKPSPIAEFATSQKAPGSAPHNIILRGASDTSFRAKWAPPKIPNGIIQGYRLYYTTNMDDDPRTWRFTTEAYNKTIVERLASRTTYYVTMRAYNKAGDGPLSDWLAVKTQKGVPSQPRNVKVQVKSSTAIVATWERPLYRGNGIFGYEIYYNKSSKDMDTNVAAIDTFNKNIMGLRPFTYYKIGVAAKSDKGVGPVSFSVIARTQEDAPSDSPQNVRGKSTESTSLEISWDPPPLEHRNGIITDYIIKYKSKGGQNRYAPVDGTKTSFVLRNLKKFTKYFVWVRANTKVGRGPFTDKYIFSTAEDVPSGAPRQLEVKVLNSSAIEVSWRPPSSNQDGRIRGYMVFYSKVDDQGNPLQPPALPQLHDSMSENNLKVTLTNLDPDTNYQIDVAGYTIKGDGARSLTKFGKTLPRPPDAPFVYSRILNKQGDVEIGWRTSAKGVIGYQIRYGKTLIRKLVAGRNNNSIPMKHLRLGAGNSKKVFNGLGKGLWYLVAVSLRTKAGWSPEKQIWVKTPPGPPTGPPLNVRALPKSSTEMEVTWSEPNQWKRNGVIVGYSVVYNDVKHRNQLSIRNITNPSQLKVVLQNLKMFTLYEIRVQAMGEGGLGPLSNPAVDRTHQDAPGPPNKVTVKAVSTSVVLVTWKAPLSPNGIITGYNVLYSDDDSLPLNQWSSQSASGHSTQIRNLAKGQMYWFRVAAKTIQYGRYSDERSGTTLKYDLPGSSRDLKAEKITSTSVSLKWLAPEIDAGMEKYMVKIEGVKSYKENGKVVKDTHKDEYEVVAAGQLQQRRTLKGLKPAMKYIIRVIAVNAMGSGPAVITTIETKRDKPQSVSRPVVNKRLITDRYIPVRIQPVAAVNGPVSHYIVVVVPLAKDGKLPQDKNPDDYFPRVRRRRKVEVEKPYIAAKFEADQLPETFNVGDASYKNQFGYYNKPLVKGVYYTVFTRAYVKTDNGDVVYKSSPFIKPIKFGVSDNSDGRVSTGAQQDPREAKSSIGLGLIVGPVAGAVVIAVIILVAVLLVRRRRRRQGKKEPRRDAEKTSEPSDPVELRRLAFQTPAMMDHPPISVADLAKHVANLKADNCAKLIAEYESIEPGQTFTTDHANMDANKQKNRYPNILAYDSTRVHLSTAAAKSGSDYINANFCDGYRKEHAYIATQGPTSETVSDFWRMIWEQRTFTIVMLTKLEERGRNKCDPYFPEDEENQTYGEIEVSLEDWVELASYTITTLQINKVGSKLPPREVKHFQFLVWPDHGVPSHPTPFLAFLRRVKFYNPPDAGPITVHCSAGVGRTACFIVIDSMLERIKHEHTVDIYGHVTVLRTQRNYMVQTQEQYIFIHDALLEAVSCGNTEVHARNLLHHIKKLTELQDGETTGLEEEFKRLVDPSQARLHRNGAGAMACNRPKNRLANILPYESTRVRLSPIRGSEGSDYINANFIDGYSAKDCYIATQGPLQETVDDFWRMLMEHNSNVVVMLTQLYENDREKCFQYWPEERSARHQYFVVDPVAEQEFPQFVIRDFKVKDARNDRVQNIKQFHFFGWPEGGVPKTGEGIIDLIGQVQRVYEQQEEEGPITVHCSDGVGRTGVFCALGTVLERMRSEGVVDLFQTVKLLRTQRPGMVQTQEQYMFCYKTALEYLGSFDHYAI